MGWAARAWRGGDGWGAIPFSEKHPSFDFGEVAAVSTARPLPATTPASFPQDARPDAGKPGSRGEGGGDAGHQSDSGDAPRRCLAMAAPDAIMGRPNGS